MSAYVVDVTYIHELVTAAMHMKVYGRYAQHRGHETVTDENATEFGRMLWAENFRSVSTRYRDPASNMEAVASYKFRLVLASPGHVAKHLACYEYQSCECDDWEDSNARRFCSGLAAELLKRLPGYAETQW